jgi:hypothetical protein
LSPALVIYCRLLPETRTQNSAAAWLAEAEVGGRRFEAKSRHGAPNALARELVAAGIPDQPIEIRYEGLAGSMRHKSFHTLAGRTFTKSASTPVRRVVFREYPEEERLEGAGALRGEGQERGEGISDGSLEGDNRVTPKSGDLTSDRECALPTCGKRFRPWRTQSVFCSQACRQKAYRERKLTDQEVMGQPIALPQPAKSEFEAYQ